MHGVAEKAGQGLEGLGAKKVVVLPDLFIDALAFLPSWAEASERMAAIAGRGGGNLPVGAVEFKLGGNAANLALALARLGASVHLIAETDGLGGFLLGQAAKRSGLHVERVRSGPAASATLGLECTDANVMLSHAGPLEEFGPERLEDEDWRLLEQADAVALVNWGQNRRGTHLLSALSGRLAPKGTFLYLDTGDPRHRPGDAAALVADPALWRGVSAWGLNENELRAFSGQEGAADGTDALLEEAGRLATRLGTPLDLHTRTMAASTDGLRTVRVDADATPARRITGAGDSWNAGNLAGHLLGWDAEDRLRLAHAVATAYVTGDAGLPPTAAQVKARMLGA